MDEIPFDKHAGQLLNSSIKGVGKKLTSDFLSNLKLILSCSTEIFFRRDLGERHFSGGRAVAGGFLWLSSAFLSFFAVQKFAVPKLKQMKFVWATEAIGLIPLIVGLGVFIVFCYFTHQNGTRVRKIRSSKQPFHSMSHGIPRWKLTWKNGLLQLAVIGIILICAPISGIAFILSMIMTASAAAQQEAAIRGRYWDVLDAQLEGEFLQDAIEGKCDPTLTYLRNPLSEKDSDLKADMAAAAVGKPVRIVAQGPKAAFGRPPKSDAETAKQSSHRAANSTEPNQLNVDENSKQATAAATSSKTRSWNTVVIIAAFFGVAGVTYFGFKKMSKEEVQPAVTAAQPKSEFVPFSPPQVSLAEKPRISPPRSDLSANPVVIPAVVQTSHSPRVKSAPPQTSTSALPPSVLSSPPNATLTTKTEFSEPPPVKGPTAAEIKKQQKEEMIKIADQILGKIQEEIGRIDHFSTNSASILTVKRDKVGFFDKKRRATLKVAYERISKTQMDQHAVLDQWMKNLEVLSQSSPTVASLQEQLNQVIAELGKMTEARARISAEIEAL